MGNPIETSIALDRAVARDCRVDRLAALYKIGRRIDKTGPQGGQPRKPIRWMIRGLFLQCLYQLSDPQLEDQLIDRLSFCRFVGLPLDQTVPDFTTFWRFCEALAAEGLVEKLFDEITRQIEAKGLILKQGTVVDAGIIESSGCPFKSTGENFMIVLIVAYSFVAKKA